MIRNTRAFQSQEMFMPATTPRRDPIILFYHVLSCVFFASKRARRVVDVNCPIKTGESRLTASTKQQGSSHATTRGCMVCHRCWSAPDNHAGLCVLPHIHIPAGKQPQRDAWFTPFQQAKISRRLGASFDRRSAAASARHLQKIAFSAREAGHYRPTPLWILLGNA